MVERVGAVRVRRIFCAFAAAAAAALTLAACSSSGGTSATGSSGTDTGGAPAPSAASSTTTASTAASGTTIKVGLICSCTSPLGATTAVAAKVAQAWANSVNASGGVNGHPVELSVKDDQSNPGSSVTALQSLISSNVSAIIDLSTVDATWQKAVDAAKIPVIGGNALIPQYDTDPNFYSSGQTLSALTYSNMSVAKLAGAKVVSEIYCAEAPVCAQAVPANKAAALALGMKNPYNAAVSGTAPNYTAQCVAAKDAGVDALFIADSASVFLHMAEDCERQGYNPIFIENGIGYSAQLAAAPALKNNLWAPFPVLPFFANTPAVQKMNAAVDKYYPGIRKDPVNFSEQAAQAWTAGLLIGKAIEQSGVAANADFGAADMINGLNKTKNETLDGWSPPLTFTAGKPHPVDCWFVGRLQNGKPELANGGKLSCQPK